MARGGLLGDWEGKLSKLIALSTALVEKKMNGAMITRARAVIASQQKREFKTSIGPNGDRWPAPKDDPGQKPLDRSGSLKGSAYAVVEGADRVRFGFSDRAATIVAKGRKGVPARSLIPDAEQLGPVWGPRLLGALRQLISQMVKEQAVPKPSEGD